MEFIRLSILFIQILAKTYIISFSFLEFFSFSVWLSLLFPKNVPNQQMTMALCHKNAEDEAKKNIYFRSRKNVNRKSSKKMEAMRMTYDGNAYVKRMNK